MSDEEDPMVWIVLQVFRETRESKIVAVFSSESEADRSLPRLPSGLYKIEGWRVENGGL